MTSVGSRGDSYDNALAESVIGLYKAELVERKGPWRGLDDLEYATLAWVDWFNTRRFSSRSDTSLRPSTKRAAISRPPWPASTHSPSEIPGTIHFVNVTVP